MSTSQKWNIVLAVCLFLALCGCGYLVHALYGSMDSAQHAAAQAAIATATAATHAAKVAEQEAELDTASERIAELIALADSQVDAARINSEHKRKSAMSLATGSATGLRIAVAQAADIGLDEVTGDTSTDSLGRPTGVHLSYMGALHLIDHDLTLHASLDATGPASDLRDARSRKEITDLYLPRALKAELRVVDLEGQTLLLRDDRDWQVSEVRRQKAETLKWSLISAGLGIVAGVVAGGVGVAYVKH